MPIYGSPTPREAFKPAVRQVGVVVCDGFSLLVADSCAHKLYELVRGALAIVSRKFGGAVSREIAGQLLPGAGDQLLPVTGDIDAAKYKVHKGAQWLAENRARPVTIEDAGRSIAAGQT
ncbi:hypothetical protein ACFPTO_15555 [Paraburkholderia denitrificans]|uniref:Uncharacterized protein n=1 Tax=Paraburkholderia denitrificans TaxID=694025 RepID=A0ABW0JBA9_9BURK